MEKNKRNTRGITLIALVITIIVLLILAGVTITVLSGENGILTQTSNAKMETRGANVEEAKGNITITIDENHPCIVETWGLDFKTMLAGIGNFVDPEQARAENAIYRERYDGPESFDLTQNLKKTSYYPKFNEKVKQLNLIIDKELDADVILTYNGKEYVTKSDFWIPM